MPGLGAVFCSHGALAVHSSSSARAALAGVPHPAPWILPPLAAWLPPPVVPSLETQRLPWLRCCMHVLPSVPRWSQLVRASCTAQPCTAEAADTHTHHTLPCQPSSLPVPAEKQCRGLPLKALSGAALGIPCCPVISALQENGHKGWARAARNGAPNTHGCEHTHQSQHRAHPCAHGDPKKLFSPTLAAREGPQLPDTKVRALLEGGRGA